MPRPAATAVAVALLGAGLVLAGCGGPRARYAGVTSTVSTRGQDGAAAGLDAARDFRSVRGYRGTPAPVRLEIPRIGVDTGLLRLGRDTDGTVEVPEGPRKWDTAGWYAGQHPWESIYGTPLRLAEDARRFDVSPAWKITVPVVAV